MNLQKERKKDGKDEKTTEKMKERKIIYNRNVYKERKKNPKGNVQESRKKKRKKQQKE